MTKPRQQKLGSARAWPRMIAPSLICVCVGAWGKDAASGYPRETIEQFIIACQGDDLQVELEKAEQECRP
jgi:hypothetical protein